MDERGQPAGRHDDLDSGGLLPARQGGGHLERGIDSGVRGVAARVELDVEAVRVGWGEAHEGVLRRLRPGTGRIAEQGEEAHRTLELVRVGGLPPTGQLGGQDPPLGGEPDVQRLRHRAEVLPAPSGHRRRHAEAVLRRSGRQPEEPGGGGRRAERADGARGVPTGPVVALDAQETGDDPAGVQASPVRHQQFLAGRAAGVAQSQEGRHQHRAGMGEQGVVDVVVVEGVGARPVDQRRRPGRHPGSGGHAPRRPVRLFGEDGVGDGGHRRCGVAGEQHADGVDEGPLPEVPPRIRHRGIVVGHHGRQSGGQARGAPSSGRLTVHVQLWPPVGVNRPGGSPSRRWSVRPTDRPTPRSSSRPGRTGRCCWPAPGARPG